MISTFAGMQVSDQYIGYRGSMDSAALTGRQGNWTHTYRWGPTVWVDTRPVDFLVSLQGCNRQYNIIVLRIHKQ